MIVCVAANPSVDKLFEVQRVTVGAIHRPLQDLQVPGGKGLNAARAAVQLGAEVRAVTLLSGNTGRWIEQELAREGVPTEVVWADGESRMSLSVADRESGGLTEFYENGVEIDDRTWDRFALAVEQTSAGADWLTISGSLPQGAPDDAYRRLPVTCAIAVDTVAERPAHAALVKINAAEAATLTGIDTTTRHGAVEAARQLAEGGVAAVTRGAQGAVLVAGDLALEGSIDERGRYPVGSGDSFLAGIVTARDRGAGWREALALALGAAAANADVPGAGRFARADAERLAARATITEL